jgi:hypothetical protein
VGFATRQERIGLFQTARPGSAFSLDLGFTSNVELGRSPGGREENTGNASAFNDKLMMGNVDVILTNPVKFGIPSRGPRLADPCARGPMVTV